MKAGACGLTRYTSGQRHWVLLFSSMGYSVTSQWCEYSKTRVREPPSRLALNSGWCGKSCLSYKGTCHVILLAKLHDMYLYKTTTFSHQPLRSISKVAVLHRFTIFPIYNYIPGLIRVFVVRLHDREELSDVDAKEQRGRIGPSLFAQWHKGPLYNDVYQIGTCWDKSSSSSKANREYPGQPACPPSKATTSASYSPNTER